MAPNSKQKMPLQCPVFQLDDDDDDFQDAGGTLPALTMTPRIINRSNASPLQKRSSSSSQRRQRQHLKPSNSVILLCHPSKSPKTSINATGKENLGSISAFLSKAGAPHFVPSPFNSTSPLSPSADSTAERGCLINDYASPSKDDCHHQVLGFSSNIIDDCRLDSIESTIDCGYRVLLSGCGQPPEATTCGDSASAEILEEEELNLNQIGGCSSNSLECRLLTSAVDPHPYETGNYGSLDDDDKSGEFEGCTQLDMLLKLCSGVNAQEGNSSGTDFEFAHHQQCVINDSPIHCPLCGTDISDLTDEFQQIHTNDCLDKEEHPNMVCPNDAAETRCPGQVFDGSPVKSPWKIANVSPVLEWLRSLDLAKYEELFVQEEIDWDTLQSLTEEDLFSIGVTALGPRRKIVHALNELRKESTKTSVTKPDASTVVVDEISRLAANKLITDYFPGIVGHREKKCTYSGQQEVEKSWSAVGRKQIVVKKNVMKEKFRNIPQWCSIAGTPFRVDAFKYLRRDCSHWFLTHFHIDHYQGLTRSFSQGKIYCSLITAKLVNIKIGIPWDKLQVLPLNQKIVIAGIDVTCFDANHCPGSIIVLFEPPNGKAVLHTGDFRFCEEMSKIPILQKCCVQTLILDTTYCNPQYDFPKQEAVIQFVVEAIQAEAFNPKTLFLIGSYTIGKERLFLEVARVLRKKVYVTAAKLRLLGCLGLSIEDMQWFTLNEKESHIHVVPMWTLASFKRLKCISNQYAHRFSLIVAFSPTGWTFGKGKKKSPGRRWQQGTIIRYEVPYSEHCSFTELREFVKFISPENILPSVNNDGPESANAMVSLLLS